MGKSTISMAIFHCYVSSPEGKSSLESESRKNGVPGFFSPKIVGFRLQEAQKKTRSNDTVQYVASAWLRGGDNNLQGNLRLSWPSGTQMHNPLLLCKTSVFQKQFQGKQEGSLQCACFIMLPSWTPCFHVKLPLTQSSAQPEFQHGEVWTNWWLLHGVGRVGDLPNGTQWWSSSIKKRSPMVILNLQKIMAGETVKPVGSLFHPSHLWKKSPSASPSNCSKPNMVPGT